MASHSSISGFCCMSQSEDIRLVWIRTLQPLKITPHHRDLRTQLRGITKCRLRQLIPSEHVGHRAHIALADCVTRALSPQEVTQRSQSWRGDEGPSRPTQYLHNSPEHFDRNSTYAAPLWVDDINSYPALLTTISPFDGPAWCDDNGLQPIHGVNLPTLHKQ